MLIPTLVVALRPLSRPVPSRPVSKRFQFTSGNSVNTAYCDLPRLRSINAVMKRVFVIYHSSATSDVNFGGTYENPASYLSHATNRYPSGIITNLAR